MKLYIYLFVVIILLLIITLITLYECREGYASSYSGPSGLYSLTDPSNPLYNRIGRDRNQVIKELSATPPAMAPSPSQSKTIYNNNNFNVEYLSLIHI